MPLYLCTIFLWIYAAPSFTPTLCPLTRPTIHIHFCSYGQYSFAGGETERGTVATLILDQKVDSHKLAERAKGWGFKVGDEGVMGLDSRGIGLLLVSLDPARRYVGADAGLWPNT